MIYTLFTLMTVSTGLPPRLYGNKVMSYTWYDSVATDDMRRLSSNFWEGLRSDINSNMFWTERIKLYKDEPDERLKISMDNLPLPGAFKQAAIALRAIIRSKRKEKIDYNDELTMMYWLAAVDSFSIPDSRVCKEPGFNVIESIPGSIIRELPFEYKTLGYTKLPLLNQSDIKWLTEMWGKPKRNSTLHALHKDVWKQYEIKLVERRERETEELIRALR